MVDAMIVIAAFILGGIGGFKLSNASHEMACGMCEMQMVKSWFRCESCKMRNGDKKNEQQ